MFPLAIVGIFFLSYNLASISKAQTSASIDATVQISVCGNDTYEGGEDCDGSDFGGLSCLNYGFDSGDLNCNIDCSIDTSECVDDPDNPGGSSGGGGGGLGTPPTVGTTVNISGRAYPLRKVVVLKDGQIAIETIAGGDAQFSTSLTGLAGGNYTFSVYAEDVNGLRSALFTFPVFISAGATTNITGVFLAPSIEVDKSQVKYGDNIALFGQSTPNSSVTIQVNSTPVFRQVITDANGIYLHNFDTSVLELGTHNAKSKFAFGSDASSYGRSVAFDVGNSNVLKDDSSQASSGDVNTDGKINLVDFSIVAFWYKRPNPPSSADLNKDGKVDLIDFSIMAFNWTG